MTSSLTESFNCTKHTLLYGNEQKGRKIIWWRQLNTALFEPNKFKSTKYFKNYKKLLSNFELPPSCVTSFMNDPLLNCFVTGERLAESFEGSKTGNSNWASRTSGIKFRLWFIQRQAKEQLVLIGRKPEPEPVQQVVHVSRPAEKIFQQLGGIKQHEKNSFRVTTLFFNKKQYVHFLSNKIYCDIWQNTGKNFWLIWTRISSKKSVTLLF